MPHDKNRRLLYVLLFILVAIGIIMRFDHLEKKSLWADELFTLSMAIYHPLVPAQGQPWYRPTSVFFIEDGDTFWTAKAAEQHPPLQDLLEKASVRLLGISEFSVRLPGVLAACALLIWFAVFAARREDPVERRTLTWALLLLTFCPALLVYAQDARAYSLGTSLVGMGGLLWAMRWRQGWREVTPPSWLEIALFTLACYSHYNAAALVALLMAADFFLACKKRNLVTLLRLSVLTAVFSLWVALSAHTILATSQGVVSWGKHTALTYALSTVDGAVAIMHAPWLLAWLMACGVLLIFYWPKEPDKTWPRWAVSVLVLAHLVLLYLVLAGFIVAKAQMTHVRFYIFIFPMFAMAAGLLLAQLQQRWAMALAAIFVMASAAPQFYANWLGTFQDFRGMSHVALRDFKQDSKFLFPWPANRNLYRIYLEPWFTEDIRPRMIGISTTADAEKICAQLAGTPHVAAIGHDSGKPLIYAVYDACGSQWPIREQHQLHETFAEHWRVAPVPEKKNP